MKFSRSAAPHYQVDDVQMEELFDGRDFAFDVALGKIHGHHRKVVNRVSDRAYFVLQGDIVVHVGAESIPATTHDLVVVPAGTPHGVDGTGEYVVITAPSWAEENEQFLERP